MNLNPQFDQVFHLLPNPSLLLLADAPKFTITSVNNAYLKAMNFKEEDFIGKGIFEIFPEKQLGKTSNDNESLRNSLNLVVAKKDSYKMPLQKYDVYIPGTSKFKVRYANVQHIPIKDDNNNITHILHTVEDVTDTKNREISFENERLRFNDLYLQAPSCMGILKGINHVFELANPPCLKLIGEKDIIGKTVREVFPEVEGQVIFKILDTVYKTGKTFSAKEMLIKFDKEGKGKIVEMYQDVIYQPHKDKNGAIDGIFFFFIDVTEKVESRKKIEESEKRYWELIENIPLATYSCDAEGHILIYNKALATLWAREPEIGKDKWYGSMKVYNGAGDLLAIDSNSMAAELQKGGVIVNQELIIERPDGEKMEILPYAVPSFDAAGTVTGTVIVLIDITSSKKAELKLIQSEKSLKDSQAVANLGNWDLNFATGISIWSDELCRIYGLSPAENIQTYENWLSFIHPDDMDEVLRIINESQKTFGETILNHRIVLKDGTIKHTLGKNKYSFNIKGEPVGLYGIAQDVTGPTQSEETVRFQSKLLNIITQATISTNALGIVNFWNNTATETYGWTAKEALGQSVISLISAEQKEFETHEIMEELSKGTASRELVVKHKDGHTFPVFSSISPIYDKQGKFEGTIEVSHDITERKKEEQKLKKLNKELSDYKYALDESSIVAITDQKGIIKHVNDNFCEISQFSREELIGQDHRIINSGYHSKEYIKNLWKTISKGEIWKGELKNKAKDGSFYWVNTTITPFLDDRGKPYQYVVTRFDITKRKEAEGNIIKQNEELVIQSQEKTNRATELSLSNKELVKTNLELDHFVYSVSHDLRSPLTSILGLISLIEEDSKEIDTLKQVKMIRTSINRLDGFIKNILNYSQNNRTGLETQKIPIKKAINEIVDSVRNIKEAKGISFQIDVDEQKPFYSDPHRFNTVIENLVSNAIKHHSKDTPGRYLKISATTNNQELKLSIADNGIGIDPEFHDKIFEMFYRLPGSTDGSGFGLYIVKETLSKMQGKIEIQSKKGVGTTFIITLKNLK